MIYNNEFIWLHFPKCAGTKIEQLFKRYYLQNEDIYQDIVNIKIDPLISWHDTIAQREARDPNFKLRNQVVIFPFRRLHSWLESKYNYVISSTPDLTQRPEILLDGKFPESNGQINHADSYIKQWLPDSILQSHNIRFIRTENFKEDFVKAFKDFIDLSKIPEWEYDQKANSSESKLPEKIKHKLQIDKDKLYQKCPKWYALEKRVYGT